jgi:hypothetical protein
MRTYDLRAMRKAHEAAPAVIGGDRPHTERAAWRAAWDIFGCRFREAKPHYKRLFSRVLSMVCGTGIELVIPAVEWQAACEAAQQCDVFVSCGTSSVVQPAASLIDMAIRAGATTVQVNPNTTDYDDSVTVSIRGPAGIVLPRIVEETWNAV